MYQHHQQSLNNYYHQPSQQSTQSTQPQRQYYALPQTNTSLRQHPHSHSLPNGYNHHTASLPATRTRARSQPSLSTMSQYNRQPQAHGQVQPQAQSTVPQAQSTIPQPHAGINFQSLQQQTAPRTSSINSNPNQYDLSQFIGANQAQIQQTLSTYPAWLQKEYMRRIKRQYEELYVVEDPKIHHWSNICPRKSTITKHENDENMCSSNNVSPSNVSHDNDGLRLGLNTDDDDDYFSSSESIAISPSPYSYSPNNPENTTSPKHKPSRFLFSDNELELNKFKSPSMQPITPGRPLVTCLLVLDDLKTNDNDTDHTTSTSSSNDISNDTKICTNNMDKNSTKSNIQQVLDTKTLTTTAAAIATTTSPQQQQTTCTSNVTSGSGSVNVPAPGSVTVPAPGSVTVPAHVPAPVPVPTSTVPAQSSAYYTTTVQQQHQQQQNAEYQRRRVQEWYARQEAIKQQAAQYQQLLLRQQQQQLLLQQQQLAHVNTVNTVNTVNAVQHQYNNQYHRSLQHTTHSTVNNHHNNYYYTSTQRFC